MLIPFRPTQVRRTGLIGLINILGMVGVVIKRYFLTTRDRGQGHRMVFEIYLEGPSVVTNGCFASRYGLGDRQKGPENLFAFSNKFFLFQDLFGPFFLVSFIRCKGLSGLDSGGTN